MSLSLNKREETFSSFKVLAEAFQKDCKELLISYQKLKSLSFKTFSNVWKKKRFYCIYGMHKQMSELKPFVENCFFIAKRHLYKEDINYKTGALFLLYGLYYQQPIIDFVKVRLTLSDYEQILEILRTTASQKSYDAAFIFAKMKLKNCFQYVATPQYMLPEYGRVSREIVNTSIDDTFSRDTVIDEFYLNCQNKIELGKSSIDKFSALDQEYQAALKKYKETNPSDFLLDFDSNATEKLKELYRKVVICTKREPSEIKEEEKEEIGDQCSNSESISELVVI